MKQLNLFFKSILIITILIIFNSCNNDSNKIRVTVNSWVGFGPLYIAQERGIFERNGLNIEIIKLENAPDRRAALLSNRVEIVASSLDDLAVTLSQGIDAVAFACADYSNGSDAIISRKDIKSLDTLINFSIAVQPGFVNHFFLLYVLDKNGIPTNDLKINPMTPDDAGAAFIAGKIDAAVTWEPFITKARNSKNGCNILASSDKYPEAILDLFIAKKEWFEKNNENIAAFKKSWDESLIFMDDNKEISYGIIGREIGIESSEVEAMLSGVILLSNKKGKDIIMKDLDSLSVRVERLWRNAGFVKNDIDLKSSVIF